MKLLLFDDKNCEVGSAFYWRSNDKYQGKPSLTEPTTSGFEEISKLNPAQVKGKFIETTDSKNHVVTIEIKNTSKIMAFFTQIQL